MPDKVKCLECEQRGNTSHHHHLRQHLEDIHDMSIQTYRDRHGPDVDLLSEELVDRFDSQSPDRKGTERFDDVLKVGDIEIEHRSDEPVRTFDRPFKYSYPRRGKASEAVERLARSIKYRKHVYLYGPAGTGKSAAVRAIGHDLGMEGSHYPMREGLDPELYLGRESVVIDEETGQNVTEFVEGPLLEDLQGREKDGEKRGVLILIDDIDRAPPEYHEILRHVIERNAESVFIPELGVSIDVHPDTQIVATANSLGKGDSTGHYASVQRMDKSIQDRFHRAIRMTFLERQEEREIIENKFPDIRDEYPAILDDVMEVTEKIREMIENKEIHVTFSHRRVVQWVESIRELIREKGYYEGVTREASRDWLEWYDEVTRETVISRVLDMLTHPPE